MQLRAGMKKRLKRLFLKRDAGERYGFGDIYNILKIGSYITPTSTWLDICKEAAKDYEKGSDMLGGPARFGHQEFIAERLYKMYYDEIMGAE